MKLATLLAAVLAFSSASVAQAGQNHQPRSKAGVFDYYVLNLSWAPEYCKTHADDTAECGSSQPGFVLHGLWPQYSKSGYPSSCASQQKLDADALALGRTVFPSEKLVTHEWQKHGTCSGLTAMAYIQAADTAHKSVTIPAILQPGKNQRSLALANITQAVLDANPALNRQSLAIVCTGGELSEVEVCLSKDLKPTSCGRDVSNKCGATVTLLGVQ
jgi:ribonuclease T2